MKMVVTQNEVGRFNLLGNEETLEFNMVIRGDDGVVIKDDEEHLAKLYYSGEPDEKYDFEEAENNLAWVFDKCFDYAHQIASSTDYKGNCLFFLDTYMNNFDEIRKNTLEEEKKKINEEIKSLELQLENLDMTDFREDCIEPLLEKRESYMKSIGYYEKQMAEMKEESESYNDRKKWRDEYKNKVQNIDRKVKEYHKRLSI